MSIDGQHDVAGLRRAGAAVSIGAQFEHTLIVTRGEPIVVTG